MTFKPQNMFMTLCFFFMFIKQANAKTNQQKFNLPKDEIYLCDHLFNEHDNLNKSQPFS